MSENLFVYIMKEMIHQDIEEFKKKNILKKKVMEEKKKLKILEKQSRRKKRLYFRKYVVEDLMKNRFHPKNIHNFNDWGFQTY